MRIFAVSYDTITLIIHNTNPRIMLLAASIITATGLGASILSFLSVVLLVLICLF